jgi:SMC interacting uncharacterized protein involved in chromosome segregation
MKNIFLFSSLALLLSCQSFDKEITAINDLVLLWDSTSMMATDLSNTLNEANADFTQKMASISIDSMALSKLPADQQGKISEAQNNLMGFGNQLSQVTNDVGNFFDAWNEESEIVNALEESLTTQQFSETTLTDAAELSQFATEAQVKLEELKQTVAAARSGVMQQHGDLSGLLAALQN